MSDESHDKAKAAILRRWRDAGLLATDYPGFGLTETIVKTDAARALLAELFAERYPGEDIDEAQRAESARRLTSEEYDALVRAEGPVYAAMEAGSRSIAAWRAEHPDDGRDDLELICAPDGPFAGIPFSRRATHEHK